MELLDVVGVAKLVITKEPAPNINLTWKTLLQNIFTNKRKDGTQKDDVVFVGNMVTTEQLANFSQKLPKSFQKFFLLGNKK
tara:strand:- start:646 stop:888 length:243 start_codon:yes stop_codon:yes gene_type:complete